MSVMFDGAHHQDLMFSHPADPDSVRQARRLEMEHVRRWVQGWPVRGGRKPQQQRPQAQA